MDHEARLSRRRFLVQSGTAGVGLAAAAGFGGMPRWLQPADSQPDGAAVLRAIKDAEIRAGVEAAIAKNLLPAATERVYPGHFTIAADGVAYGAEYTWPGLDSWQMAGAYLLLGRTRMVLDYFEFVRASQRKDGNIPFAIFDDTVRPGGCLRGLKYPDDLYTYQPPKRAGGPASSQEPRRWIGLFEHWQAKGFPLGALAPVCYELTAAEIFDATKSVAWLKERLESLEAAARYLLTMRNETGLIGGSGFYTEAPPREGSDGVTQCYTIHAFRELARLCGAAGENARESTWTGEADKLAKTFVAAFWRKDHFGEYVHPEHGLVDSHGLSDVNWAAVGFGVATDREAEQLWPRMLSQPGFWLGDMPTQTVTKPFTYEKWEINEAPPCPAPVLNDVAAMGRAWYLEAMACKRMRARERLVESVRKVCQAAKADGYWRERYHPQPDGTVTPDGAQKYCEYAAVLVRVVFGNQDVFCG
jgi:hypothetical protein